MRKPNHRPQRTCIACNEVDAKAAMIRIIVSDGKIIIDRAQVMPGRGGYLHDQDACLERFLKSKVREFRSLRRKITFDERARITRLIRDASSEHQTAELR